MRVVSNEEFEAAINNPDYIGIVKSVINNSKRNRVMWDERQFCIYNSIWQALRRYEPNRGCKFTSYLHTCTKWCIYRLNKKTRKNQVPIKTNAQIAISRLCKIESRDLLDAELDYGDERIQILTDRYISNMLLKEIADKYDMSVEWVRERISAGIKLVNGKD